MSLGVSGRRPRSGRSSTTKVAARSVAHDPDTAFRHEALFYVGADELIASTVPFVRDGLAADEAVLVALPSERLELLRDGLGSAAAHVRFADMEALGRNPARIIPAWTRFVADHAGSGRRLRGIGEPVWAGRSPAELSECHRHERLLNVAFAESPPWWLICPYDTAALSPDVLRAARASHPVLNVDGVRGPSGDYVGPAGAAADFDEALPEPTGPVDELAFGRDQLQAVRAFAGRHAAEAGMGPAALADLVLAVNELATNSLCHGGGGGMLRAWREGGALVVEVRDTGHIGRPLAGRELPHTGSEGGRGLWLVNQVCDLVEARSSPGGTTVRVWSWPR